MKSHRLPLILLAACALAGATIATSTPAHAGFADRIKKKLGDKANETADKAVDQGADKSATGNAPNAATSDATGETPASGDKGTVATVSTKFDYVPGDSILFADDFTQDELGEFPSRWKLAQGTFEIAEMQGERWLRCTSSDGNVRMKVPPALPEFWTLEFDFYCADPGGAIALTLGALNEGGGTVWEVLFPYSNNSLFFRSGPLTSDTPLTASVKGRHHIMLLARGKGLKVYVDRERAASVPEYTAGNGVPTEFDFHLGASSPPMLTNVRFAEGPRPAKDMLAAGKLVTYGIHFASGSDVVLPESAPVLRQVAAYMQANAAVKLKITGHTDNVGTPAGNLDLSRRRAAAVANALSGQLGIAADRFTTDGKGDTQAVTSNASPEGRAMNRRVEFAKL